MDAPRHLVWDWNGTLVDDLPLVVKATNVALRTVGGPPVTVEHHRRRFRRPVSDYYADVLGRPVDEAEFAVLNKLFHDAYQAGLPCALAADAERALRAWSGPQSLLSMWFHDELLPAVAGHGIAGYFARIDGLRQRLSGEVAHKEPFLARHLAEMGLHGQQVVLIGDSVDDARAARAAGAQCVLYTGGFTSAAQLRATGAPVVDSLLDAVALASDTM